MGCVPCPTKLMRSRSPHTKNGETPTIAGESKEILQSADF